MMSTAESMLFERLTSLRQHQQDGKRSPHKPLLVLLALGELASTGSSELPWSVAESRLARLIAEFGPPSRTGAAQSAAYPFTRLRSDGIWTLSEDVPMDRVGPLMTGDVVGRLDPLIEAALSDPVVLHRTARSLAENEFPATMMGDVLAAVGLDPDLVSAASSASPVRKARSATWPARVLDAWDRQCAFCGYDGQLGGGSVGLEAAHLRWFNFGGPDDLDNGLALCSLHHKLLDRGVLGLTGDHRIKISAAFTARTPAGRLVYELADLELRPRPGTPLPAISHQEWHDREVFKGVALVA